MSTFWLKIAILAVVAIGVLLAVTVLLPSKHNEPKPQPRTFYDVAAEDKDRLSGPPRAEDLEQRPESESAEPQARAESEEPDELVEPGAQPKQVPETLTLYFKDMPSEIDRIEAERLLGVAVPGRSIGRLPMTGFNLMVQNCRQIMRRWPDTIYDYKARRLLNEMPERFRARYKITEDELDMERFTQHRPETKAYTVQGSD